MWIRTCFRFGETSWPSFSTFGFSTSSIRNYIPLQLEKNWRNISKNYNYIKMAWIAIQRFGSNITYKAIQIIARNLSKCFILCLDCYSLLYCKVRAGIWMSNSKMWTIFVNFVLLFEIRHKNTRQAQHMYLYVILNFWICFQTIQNFRKFILRDDQ